MSRAILLSVLTLWTVSVCLCMIRSDVTVRGWLLLSFIFIHSSVSKFNTIKYLCFLCVCVSKKPRSEELHRVQSIWASVCIKICSCAFAHISIRLKRYSGCYSKTVRVQMYFKTIKSINSFKVHPQVSKSECVTVNSKIIADKKIPLHREGGQEHRKAFDFCWRDWDFAVWNNYFNLGSGSLSSSSDRKVIAVSNSAAWLSVTLA